MKRFLPHPLLLVCILFCVAIGRWQEVLYAGAALLVHEGGHYLVARRRGFCPASFSLTPCGATMSFEDGLTGEDELIVALAGPLFNLALCPLLLALWWLFPSLYPATKPLFFACFSLAAYNLLPVYPFDGGRVILAAAKNKKKAYRVLRVAAYVLSVLSTGMGIASLFLGYGANLLCAGTTLLFCTAFPPKNAKYKLIFDQMEIFSAGTPLEKREIYCDGRVTVSRLLRRINQKNVLYVVRVTLPSASLFDRKVEKRPALSGERAGRGTVTLCGERLNALYFTDRRLTLYEVLTR